MDKRHLPVSFKHRLPGCQAFPASLQDFLSPRDSAWIASFPATRITSRGINGTACAISAMPVSSPRAGAVRSWGSQSRILACRISVSIDMVLNYFLDVLRRILSSAASICQDVDRSLGLLQRPRYPWSVLTVSVLLVLSLPPLLPLSCCLILAP